MTELNAGVLIAKLRYFVRFGINAILTMLAHNVMPMARLKEQETCCIRFNLFNNRAASYNRTKYRIFSAEKK